MYPTNYTYNSLKSEQPIYNKGLLMMPHGTFFVSNNRYQTRVVEEDAVQHKTTWHIPQVLDQQGNSKNVGYCLAAYLGCEKVKQDFDMAPQEFADKIYQEAFDLDDVPAYVSDRLYGTTLIAGMEAIKKRNLIANYYWIENVSDLSYRVLYDGPSIIATEWTNMMSNLDPNGFARAHGTYEGNHCFVVYGADDKWETFFAVNTWGKSYGKDGKFHIRYKDMERMLNKGYALATKK